MVIARIAKSAFPRKNIGQAFEKLREHILAECGGQKGRLFLWAPAFMAFGIGFYFILPSEPPLALGVLAFLAAIAGTVLIWGHAQRQAGALICLLLATGFLSAQIRTHLIHTPILEKKLNTAGVEGTITAIEDLGDGEGGRLILSDLVIEKLEPRETPVKIRLKIREDSGLQVGQRVRVLAGLNPPSPPVVPGGFDFQRYLYFQQIGSVGFVYNDAEILENSAGPLAHLIERKRQAIAQTIEENLEYPAASIAMALLIGRRTAIDDEDQQAMRDAGLAHLLAISGMHVGLFAAVMFFFTRLILVSIPGLALRHPVKKYAALVALAGAFLYMLLAGATIPTQRALMMTGIVLLAIMLDRSPISLRLVAFAALAVLLISPESLLSASFHMSFAAVTALVVFYTWLRPWWSEWHRKAGFARRAALYFAGICLTTLIASSATTPFALFHFQRVAVYDLLANVITVPVFALMIMPPAVLSLLLMPLGLEFLPLQVMGIGIDAMLEVAHWVADLPMAVLKIAAWPQSSLAIMVMGFVILFLWNGSLRYTGLVLLALSLIPILNYKQPDILVSSTNNLSAFITADQTLQASTRRSERFVLENWEEFYGVEEGSAQVWPREGSKGTLTCGEQGCRALLKGYHIAFPKTLLGIREECAWADVVIVPEPLKDWECNARVVVDKFDTWRGGAHALWLDPDWITVKTSEELRGNRPWSALNKDFK